MNPTPKSYLPADERERLLREGGMDLVSLVESGAADKAGDGDTAWAWLALADLPAHSLKFLKVRHGADFIREKGFRTENADAAYGAGWLDRD